VESVLNVSGKIIKKKVQSYVLKNASKL